MSYSSPRSRVAVAMLVLVCASTARALELDWQAPAGCPTAQAVIRDVQRLAGATEGASLVARAAVTQTPDQRWRVAIDLSGSATGHRSLIADNCPQLARASALIIALAANPEAALDLASDEPLPALPPSRPIDNSNTAAASTGSEKPTTKTKLAVQTKPTGEAPQSEDSMRALPARAPQPPDRSERWASRTVSLFARAGFEHGALPTTTGWIGVGASFHPSPVPIAFVISPYVTQGTSATYDNGIGASFRFFAAQAATCFHPSIQRWFIAGCGGIQLSATRAEGYLRSGNHLGPSYSGAEVFVRYRWIVAPMMSLGLGYEVLPRLTAELGGAIAFPLKGWQFVVENLGPLFSPNLQQLMVYAGLGLGF